MEGSIYSLLPPLLAIVMVILTRRVLLSLGTGIIASALLLAKGNLGETGSLLWGALKGIFIDEGEIDTWNLYIVLFLFVLGAITALVNMAGGSRAFGEWALTKVKSRAGAQILTAFLGIIIFIDDYFNALAVGQVARPITDRHRVSRAKLAYIIDSTSAPVCVVSPISSWGAFIIGIIGTVFVTHQITDLSPLTAFIQMIPMNLYVWTSIAFVFIIASRNIDFGSMLVHETRAVATGETYDPEKQIPGEIKENLPTSDQGAVGDLIWPIATLFIATFSAIIWSGWNALDRKSNSLMEIFGEADVSAALLYGGLIALFVTIVLFLRQRFKYETLQSRHLFRGLVVGMKSMVPAVVILIFAWALSGLIGQLGTGTFLGNVVAKSQLNTAFLPAMMFLVAGLIAFSTGTSWGSFGILLPIAGHVVAATDFSLLLPTMAAVLAGAVFGDHCSPISDTTILSSTGAGCNHIDHVVTQLPYAVTAAIITTVGYLIIGFTSNTIFGLLTIVTLLLLFTLTMKKRVVETDEI